MNRKRLTENVFRKPLFAISSRRPVLVPPNYSVGQVIGIMKFLRCRAVLVSRPPQKLMGIFTERDLVLQSASKIWERYSEAIKDTMTPDPHCFSADDSIGFALNTMIIYGYRHLPFRNLQGDLGILSAGDLLKYLNGYLTMEKRGTGLALAAGSA